MARTIGRRLPADIQPGDYVAVCDYCDVPWYRSQLYRDASGLLVCPDEGTGRDMVTLSRLNAARAREQPSPMPRHDGGRTYSNSPATVHNTTLEHIESGSPVDVSIGGEDGSVDGSGFDTGFSSEFGAP